MIKLTKNGITTLKRQYCSVLLKCLAINAGVFMLAAPTMATEITEDTLFSKDYAGAIYNQSDMGGEGALYFSDELVIKSGKNSADEHIIVGPVHDFENGRDIKITGGETTFIGRSLNSSSGAIKMSGGVLNFNNSGNSENDDLTLWAAKDITISGGTINLKGEGASIDTIYDWTDGEGNPYSAPETAGNIYLSGGTINMNAQSEIATDGTINISDGALNANEGSLQAKEIINITGGTINAQNGTEIDADIVKVSGDAKITLTNSEFGGGYQVLISGGTIDMNKGIIVPGEANKLEDALLSMTGGTINMTNSYLGSNYYDESDEELYGKAGNVKLSGGVINIQSGDKNVLMAQDAEIKNTINIANNATLNAYESFVNTENAEDDVVWYDKGTLNLMQNGELNLGGTLNANVNNASKLNITSKSAKIAGNVTMQNGGVMNIGENKATVDGDVTFNKGSTLNISVTDSGNGSLSAKNITAVKDSKLILDVTKTMQVGDETSATLFSVSDSIDNNFTNEISNERYKVTTEDGKTYKIVYENTASDVIDNTETGNENTKSAAEAWDSLKNADNINETTQAVATALNQLSQSNPQAYANALTALAPETAPMVQQAATQTANQIFGAVGTRLSGGSLAANRQGMSSGDANGYEAAVWAQMMYNKSKYDKSATNKFDADTNGVALGIEKYFNPAVKAGIGYAYSKTDIDGFMRDTNIKTHTALIYGEYKPSNWYVNGIVTYGWSDYEEDKNVAGIGVKADYDVETLAMQAITGYDLHSCQSGITITPETGLRYVHIKNKAYTNSADERVKSSDSDILTGVIGARVNKTYTMNRSTLLKPEFKAAMTYDLANDDTKSVVTLVNGSSYAVQGKTLNRFGVELGAGLTAEINGNMELSVGYEGKFRNDYRDHTGLINVKYKF